MKRSLLRLTLLFLLMGTAEAFAQTVTGTVTSAGDGNSMPGVSVLLKGTTTGTSTDVDGKFTLNVNDPANAVLVFTFIGYASQEVPVQNRTSIDVTMSEDVNQLNEVVVTALGVQREAKTLVYATQTVKPQQLTEVRDANNVLNSLTGKIANVQINQGSGGPGSGARLVLRGNRSIQGSNNALIVVDGVPINNTTSSSATSDFGSVQSSDGASNINPDDIESVTVLRGASAAALYGAQAGNGVIVITTKKGTKDKVSVNINSGVTAETAFQLPDVQNTYGQGNAGVLNTAVGSSWGAKMQGQSYTNNLGKADTYSAQPDNIKDFFRTGTSLNNSIGITGGSDKMQTYLSYTSNLVQGIIRNNDMNRNTVNLRISNQISKKFSSDAKVTYISQYIKGRPRTGEENSPVIDIYQMPRSMTTAQARDVVAYDATGTPVPATWPSTANSIYGSPYWMTSQTNISELRNRIMGFVSLKYDITPWLNLTGRANLDRYTDDGQQKYNNGTLLWASVAGGFYDKSNQVVTQQWYDLTLAGSNKLTDDLKLDYRAGGIFQDVYHTYTDAQGNGLNVTNLFTMANAKNYTVTSGFDQQQTQSVFGQASFAWKEAVFLEASLREDWDSRLQSPYTNPYYSVGLSGVISELATLPQAISFLKLNASYAVVGNGGQIQLITPYYNYNAGAGNGSLSRQTTQPFPGLKPESVANAEAGFDLKLFDNRIGLSFTAYNSKSTKQLLKVTQSVVSGYNDKYINAGEVQNKGIEVVLTGTPMKSANFSWDVTYNLGINRNKIVSLFPGAPDQPAYLGGNGGFARTATPVAIPGGSYGDMYGKMWQRDSQGRFVVGADGLPIATTSQVYIGSFNPRATMGLTNSFNYKRFNARVLIDGRVGGIIVDGTEMNLAFSGIPKVTEQHRDEPWVLGGVDATGNPVNVAVTSQQFWSAGDSKVSGQRYGVAEFFTYNATNFRIRELSIGYSIPVPSNFFIKSARFSLVARNVAWIFRGSSILDIPGIGKRKLQIDPDMSLGNGNFQGVQYGTMPSTRSMGCNLNITF